MLLIVVSGVAFLIISLHKFQSIDSNIESLLTLAVLLLQFRWHNNPNTADEQKLLVLSQGDLPPLVGNVSQLQSWKHTHLNL
jgi:hypothetical protein